MTRIVQVISTVHPSHGGPSIGAVALHQALLAEGVDAVLLSADYGYPTGEGYGATARRRVHAKSRPYRLEASRGLFLDVWRSVRGASLVHIHGQYLLPNVASYLAARAHRVPFGVQVHGTLEPYQRAESPRKKALYNWVVGRRILRQAAYVHFAAESEALRAQDVVRREQTLVIPLGAALSADTHAPGSLIGTTLPTRALVVLYLGRLARKKRPDLLLRAWARVNRPDDAILIVAGPDEDFSAKSLTELSVELGCSSSVRFVGPIGAEEAAWLYANSGAFVLPSENENFAIAVAEAMLAGCAVITTPHVAAHEHVLAARAGAVVEVDEVQLAEALTEVLLNPDEARLAGERGQHYARLELSWERFAKALLARASRSSTS